MSKWVNNEKFEKFKNQKKEEKSKPDQKSGGGFFKIWRNPQKGTQDKPKTYKVRLLPDKNGDFYFKYFYHFFQTEDEKTYSILCEKTHGMDHFCPWCSVNQQLWKGNSSDKKLAYRYKRNERFVANVYIVDDPRDADAEKDNKVAGSVRLYEFPAAVEGKIANELTNDDEGFGPSIFDPERGHDLHIKVAAKKPDKNKVVWPDYSLTEFSRKPYAIGTEDEIKEIMDSVYDLTDYINKKGISWEDHEKILKQELVWDYVEDTFIKNVGKSSVKSQEKPDDQSNDEEKQETTEVPWYDESDESSDESNNSESQDTAGDADDDIDDESLIEELKGL